MAQCRPFDLPCASRYNSNAKVIQAGRCILPAGTAGASTLAFVIGATRELWEPFLSFCCQHPGFEQQDNPLDEYVMRHVTHAVQHDSTEAAKCAALLTFARRSCSQYTSAAGRVASALHGWR